MLHECVIIPYTIWLSNSMHSQTTFFILVTLHVEKNSWRNTIHAQLPNLVRNWVVEVPFLNSSVKRPTHTTCMTLGL